MFVLLGLVTGTEGLDVLELDIGSSGMRALVEATPALLLFRRRRAGLRVAGHPSGVTPTWQHRGILDMANVSGPSGPCDEERT